MDIIERLTMTWRWVDWQGVSAIGALLVAFVALLPIWIEYRRRKLQGMNFRVRVGPKLLLLRPSLQAVGSIGMLLAGSHVSSRGVLRPTEFQKVADELHIMMSQASVLEADEHDKFSAVIANLVLAAPLYGSQDLRADSARTTLELIDSTIKLFEKHGIMRGKHGKPWFKRLVMLCFV